MLLGREQRCNPNLSALERFYISILGMPIIGLRIRGRNIFSLIPKDREYKAILDAGSGTGVFSFELAKRFPKAQIIGIDILKNVVNAGNDIAKKINAQNVKFIHGNLESLNFRDKFDLIVCVDILEHIENDIRALQILNEYLTPSGTLVLHVPALYRRYPVFKKNFNFDVETHVRVGYELSEIRNKSENAGFTIKQIGFTYGFWETLANNLSYMITRARMENKMLYACAFPFLNLLSLIGSKSRPKKIGAGIYIIGQKS
ncbi:MAG: class I SAM-dependent methyltransferase [Desulfobacterales bacterium]|nr:class I SAM-dependent methyltransferase [Desulfobacterales bacterium]